jgi:CRP/FNR family cyclic AMP-dependent transcriptional regulator
MSAEQAAKFLGRIPLFADLDASEVMDVLRMTQPVTFEPGAVICKQGDPGDCMYVIEAGRCSVSIRGEGGSPIPVATLNAGEIMGEITLVDSQPRSADVSALGHVSAYRIDRSEFELLRAALHPAAFKVLRRIALTVCGRMRAVNGAVSRLVGGDAAGPASSPSGGGAPAIRTGAGGTREETGQRNVTTEVRNFWGDLMDRVRGG